MATFGTLVKSGLFGPAGQLAALLFPGAGYTISKKIAETGQKYNLPEMHISELFGGFQPVKVAKAAEDYQTFNWPGPKVDEGSILGYNNLSGGGTGGGGGGGGSSGGGTTDTGTNEEELAKLRWLAELEAAKNQARLYRSQADTTFQSLMDAAQRYRQRAEDLFRQSAQEIVNSLYENAGAAGRTSEAARRRAILQARAGGYGASSRMGLLNDVTGNLASTIGSLLARKGEQEAENLSLFQGRQGEAASQEREAEAQRNALRQYADQLESLGIQNAFTNFAQYLNNIVQNLNTLRSMNALNPAVLTSYTPNYGNLVENLNTIMGTLGKVPTTSQEVQNVSITNEPQIRELLRRMGYIN